MNNTLPKQYEVIFDRKKEKEKQARLEQLLEDVLTNKKEKDELDIALWDISSITNLSDMFRNCQSPGVPNGSRHTRIR
jgi:ssRNA-specific RNase YbeY (16S rRNA maturation enzyme)